MHKRTTATTSRRRGLALASVVALVANMLFCTVAWASDPEHTRLAMLLRQLAAFERLAQDTSQLNTDSNTRYHFDYPRLYADLARIRAGIESYLSPQRAQPRDTQAIVGQYRAENSESP